MGLEVEHGCLLALCCHRIKTHGDYAIMTLHPLAAGGNLTQPRLSLFSHLIHECLSVISNLM